MCQLRLDVAQNKQTNRIIFKKKEPRDFTLHHKVIKKLPAKAVNTDKAAPGCGDRNKAGGLRVLVQGPRTFCSDGTKP